MKRFALPVLFAFILAGCSTSQGVLRRISFDMTKEEVIKNIGSPKAVRNAVKDKSGQTIEVWVYELSTRRAGEFFGDAIFAVGTAGLLAPVIYTRNKEQLQDYWLYFHNGRLMQWGLAGQQPGDWKAEAPLPQKQDITREVGNADTKN